jgi:predicted negative regulator of RcsB-dependent stress response
LTRLGTFNGDIDSEEPGIARIFYNFSQPTGVALMRRLILLLATLLGWSAYAQQGRDLRIDTSFLA